MANIKTAYGTSTAITCTLASLAAGASRESAAIDNQTDLFTDALVSVTVKLAAGTPSNESTIIVYVYGSGDGTNYTDNATGSDAAITLRSRPIMNGIGTIATPDPGGLVYKGGPWSVAQAFGGVMPRKWGIVVRNMTNLAFDATEGNHAKSYTGIYQTSA